MKTFFRVMGLFALGILVPSSGTIYAQNGSMPPLSVSNPVLPPAPFLYVKLILPKEGKTTWLPGTPSATTYNEPTAVAIRPGYMYRLELSHLPGHPNLKLFPTLEVRGSLHPPKGQDIRKYPVPVVLNENDIAKISKGTFITKRILLENPHHAEPVSSQQDQLIEYNAQSPEEADRMLKDRGRLVLILRIGERQYSSAELAREQIMGSVWFPFQPTPPVPKIPPQLIYGNIPLYDPISGPKASEVECLFDGGDRNHNLGIGPDNQVNGLDPSDTAIEYQTSKGKRVTTSNRVCICVPRYIAIRNELYVMNENAMRRLVSEHTIRTPVPVHQLRIADDVSKIDRLAGYNTRQRPSGIESSISAKAVDQLRGRPMAVAIQKKTKVVAQVKELEELNGYPNCQMMLVKWMEPKQPDRIGQIVTFYLRYHNATSGDLSEVIVSDSLTPRLEYIEGSYKSDRAVTFTAVPNNGGSLTLRWAISGKLKPGESGIVTFKAKIR